MSVNKLKAQEDVIDFKGILYKFFSRWYYFVIAGVLTYFFANIYIKYQESVFRVTTTLLINDESNSMSQLGGLDMFNENKNLHNEIGLIKSFDMVFKAINQLGFDVSYYYAGNIRTSELYEDSPFYIELDSNSAQVINVPVYVTILPDRKVKLEANIPNAHVYDFIQNKVIGESGSVVVDQILSDGQKFKVDNLSFTVHLRNPFFVQKDGELYFVINDRNNLTQSYKNRLAVYPINKESSIIELAIAGPLVKKDIAFLNTLTEAYIKNGLEEKNQITTNTIKFIDKQLSEISFYLKDNEHEMESFRSTHKIVDLSNEASRELKNLEELEKEKASLLLNLKYYNYISEYVSQNKDIKDIVAPSAMGIPDPVLSNLIAQLIQLKSERIILGPRSTNTNPYLKTLDEKIQNVTDNLIENLQNIIKGSKISLKDLNTRIGQIEGRLNKLPMKERMLMDLQRKFNLNDHLYNFLLERRAEADITKASNKADNRILDKASLLNAYQIEPKKDLIFTSAFMLGMVIPFLLIIIIDFLNDKIYSREELEKVTKIPVLGTIGHSYENAGIVVADNPKSAISEMFRSIRINMQFLAADKQSKIIGLTSSISGEGKTFCAINLATIIAMSGKKTLLLGTDMRRPRIYSNFNLDNKKGLSTYLSNQDQLNDVISSTSVTNLDVITAGPVPPNPSELLASDKLTELFEKSRTMYDIIIVDSAPVGIISDYLIYADQIDVTLFIVKHNHTNKKQLVKINELYADEKIKNIHIVINDIRGMIGNYYYGYSQNYGYYDNTENSNQPFLNRVFNNIKRTVKRYKS